MKCTIIFACLAALLLFSGCTQPADGPNHAPAEGYDYEVSAGAGFSIALDCNPTTGYSWQVAEIDAGMAKLASQDFTPGAECEPEMTGCGGTCVMGFNALNAGTTSVTLVYCRSWECAETTEQTKAYSIKIS